MVCHQHRETVCHALWECPLACNVWGLVSGKIQKSKAYATDIFLLTRSMLERLPKDEMERWTTAAWAIWRAHNKFCFEVHFARISKVSDKPTYTLVVPGVRLVCIALEHIRAFAAVELKSYNAILAPPILQNRLTAVEPKPKYLADLLQCTSIYRCAL